MINRKVLDMIPCKIVLPFNYSPLVSMYHGCAFPIGIIMSQAEKHQKDITPWLCGKYINWMYAPKLENKYNHYFDDSWMRNDGILKLQRIHVRKNAYERIFGDLDIIDWFRLMLSNGCYPSDYYNEGKIPGKLAYQKDNRFKHDFILTGYDDNNQYFLSGGYLSDGHFHQFTIPYAIMRDAYYDTADEFITCNFWSYNEKSDYSLRLDDIVHSLSDYIMSTTSVNLCTRGRLFGLDAMQQLCLTFEENALHHESVDPRFTRGFMEHKQLMSLRIDYLSQIGLLHNADYMKVASENRRIAEVVHKLGLKYMITLKTDNIKKIQEYIQKVVESERIYLPCVLEELKKCEVLVR